MIFCSNFSNLRCLSRSDGNIYIFIIYQTILSGSLENNFWKCQQSRVIIVKVDRADCFHEKARKHFLLQNL